MMSSADEQSAVRSQLSAVPPVENPARLRFAATVYGQSIVLEGTLADLRPFIERYFGIAEQLLAHDLNIAHRRAELAAQVELAKVAAAATHN